MLDVTTQTSTHISKDPPYEPGVLLYWLPLGVGWPFRAAQRACLRGVQRQAFPSTTLRSVSLGVGDPNAIGYFTVDMTPVPNARPWERGVVAEGAVGTNWARPPRVFRYEVRLWGDGTIPDLRYAVRSPIRVDGRSRHHDCGRLPFASRGDPDLGCDELQAGEMWSCNSIISWVLTSAGANLDAFSVPLGGRAPGWQAGVTVALRRTPATSTSSDPAP